MVVPAMKFPGNAARNKGALPAVVVVVIELEEEREDELCAGNVPLETKLPAEILLITIPLVATMLPLEPLGTEPTVNEDPTPVVVIDTAPPGPEALIELLAKGDPEKPAEPPFI
jgi:hypothetical protein